MSTTEKLQAVQDWLAGLGKTQSYFEVSHGQIEFLARNNGSILSLKTRTLGSKFTYWVSGGCFRFETSMSETIDFDRDVSELHEAMVAIAPIVDAKIKNEQNQDQAIAEIDAEIERLKAKRAELV